jgi:3-oxoacyl-[acyl-carrier protein] reductase
MDSEINQDKSKSAKVAIVTGASSGVGQATALLLAESAYNLVLAYGSNDKGAEKSKQLCEKAGAKAVLVKGDIAEQSVCESIVESALKNFSRLDVLVNNAGTTKFCNHHNLTGLSGEDFHRIYAVNTIAPFQLVSAAHQHLKDYQGVVVNVASTAGLNGIGSSIAYCASKAALLNMTKSLARVLGPEVRINAVCPGFIQGDWLKEGLGESAYEKIKEKTEKATPLKATTTPEEIAEAIFSLIKGPRLMTGEYIVVDGGKSLS